MLSVEDIAFLTGWPERTARRYVGRWHESGAVRVAIVPPTAGKGRSRYAVDAGSFYAAFPQYAPKQAA